MDTADWLEGLVTPETLITEEAYWKAYRVGRKALPVLAAALRRLEEQGLMLNCLETICVRLAKADRDAAEYFMGKIEEPCRAVLAQAEELRAAHETSEPVAAEPSGVADVS